MTTIGHRSIPGASGWPGRVARVSPGAVHAVGCVSAFMVVVACGIHLADAADWSGLARSRALLATSQARAAAAQRMLADAAEPRDTRRGAARAADSPPAPAWPAVVLELAHLAGASGLRIASIEPRRTDDAAADGRRTMRIVADGDFPAVLQLMDGLARLRVLAVPAALHIERRGEEARMDMTLDVFPALPAASSTVPVLARTSGGDPFGGAGAPMVSDAPAPRLAGTIRDARAGLALFDAGDGTFAAVVPGEALGAARVTRVDAGAVTLATADGSRRLVVDDGGRP